MQLTASLKQYMLIDDIRESAMEDTALYMLTLYLALVSRQSRCRLMLLLNSSTQLSTSSRSLSFSSTSRGFTASAMKPALTLFMKGFSPASIHLKTMLDGQFNNENK